MKAFLTLAMLLTIFTVRGVCQTNKPYTSSFIGRMGVDTVLVETYTMVNNHLYGRAFIRVPEDYIAEFTLHFYPDGSIREFNVNAMNPLNGSIPFEAKSNAFEYRLNMNCQNDTCTYYNSDPDKKAERVVKHPARRVDFIGGWVPLISLMEWNCLRFAKSNLEAMPITMINHNIGVYQIGLQYKDANTMIFGGPFLEYTTIKTGKDGRISGIDGTGTPWNYIVTKHPPINIDDVAKRMTLTPGIGIPSPTQTTAYEVQSTKISVTYGRPYKRGRNIFGGVVPYDSLWRTGANGPTKIKFESPVKIQEKVVPKGEYSIYTIPQEHQWTFILSRDLESWPTDPDRSKEFLQASIPVKKTADIKQQFTIDVREWKKGGQLRFMWDDVEAVADFVIMK